MAVTITRDDLAVSLRLAADATAAAALPAGQLAILDRLFATARELVTKYAPDAPSDVQNEAAIRCGAYLYDSDPADARAVRSPLPLSGAAAILSPWRVQRLINATAR